MHSAKLKISDFKIISKGTTLSFSDFESNFTCNTRLGLHAPNRFEGVGAISLVMLYVTAFYDICRANDDLFFAYPDFYTFQTMPPVADYAIFDIWPSHKNVATGALATHCLNAINDRAINILLLPDSIPSQLSNFNKAQLESAQRNISKCFLYSFTGEVSDADFTIVAPREDLLKWGLTIFDTEKFKDDKDILMMKDKWAELYQNSDTITQSFKSISLDEALKFI